MSSFEGAFKKASLKSLKSHLKISQGDIFSVKDELDDHDVKFPEDSLPKDHPRGKRTFHGKRYVLIIQANKFNNKHDFPSALIIPLSSRGTDTEVSVVIPTKYLDDSIPDESVARIHLAQPILKIRLLKKIGHVPPSDPIFISIKAIYLHLIGDL